MATKIIRAKKFVLYLDGKIVGCASDVSLNVSRGADEVACIDSGDFDQYEPGAISWTVDLSGTSRLYTTPDAAANVGYVDLTDMLLSGAVFTVVVGSRDTGDSVYTGKAFITSASQTGANKAIGSYSVNMQGTGPLVKATNTIPVTP